MSTEIDDGSFLSEPATLQQRRARRLYTFHPPLRIRAQVTFKYDGQLQDAEDYSVTWAEGVSEDADEQTDFLVLDVLDTQSGIAWPEPVVGVWVHKASIVSAQVQTPLRVQPGAPRSIRDIKPRCEDKLVQGIRCELKRDHIGEHRSGQKSWGG